MAQKKETKAERLLREKAENERYEAELKDSYPARLLAAIHDAIAEGIYVNAIRANADKPGRFVVPEWNNEEWVYYVISLPLDTNDYDVAESWYTVGDLQALIDATTRKREYRLEQARKQKEREDALAAAKAALTKEQLEILNIR